MPEQQNETEELSRLFNLYRLANLNLRYYGVRGEKYEHYVWWLDMIAIVSSAVALFVLLTSEEPLMRFTGAGLVGIAAVCTAIAATAERSARAKRFSVLHGLYSHLFSQIESVMTQIRRDGLNAGTMGASKQVHESYRQMHAMDEMEPDEKLRDREDKKVREAFPDDYVWNNL